MNKNDKPDIDLMYVAQHKEMFENFLLLAAIKSSKFYLKMREKLCPLTERGLSRRPDFETPGYNQIYTAVASYWEGWVSDPSFEPNQDYFIDKSTFETILRDAIQNGSIPQDDAIAWFGQLEEDLDRHFDPKMIELLPRMEKVRKWLDRKLREGVINSALAVRDLRFATLSELAAAVQKAQQTLDAGESSRISAVSLIDTVQLRGRRLPTDLPELNKRLCGGFEPGSTTLIAGTNGSGKSTLAMQWGRHFAINGAKVAIFTTEETPARLVQKMLSGYLQVDFSDFTPESKEAPLTDFSQVRAAALPQPLIPPAIYEQHAEQIATFKERILNQLYFIDWSTKSALVYKDYSAELLKCVQEGWDPDVVIFDWIGGGVDSARNSATSGVDLRHLYKEAIDAIVKDAKQTRRVAIAMAQINKSLISDSTKGVTMKHLAECKSMTDNVWYFIGVSAMRQLKGQDASTATQLTQQFLNVDKCRGGTCGLVAVDAVFKYQCFKPSAARVHHQ